MNRHVTVTMTAVCVLFALGFGTELHAQLEDTLAAARKTLTGPATREWVFKQIEVFMGPGNRCAQGEALRFLADSKVEIESCVNGHMNDQTENWTLRSNGVLDPILSYAGADYELTFSDSGRKHFMRLRKRGVDRTDPAFDRLYRLSED
jgi:hypothetical protein